MNVNFALINGINYPGVYIYADNPESINSEQTGGWQTNISGLNTLVFLSLHFYYGLTLIKLSENG
jgi:hypothetical protein